MSKFSYAYKTSDGVRHTGEMNAPSKDAVFETLRKQGIRPIKVTAVSPFNTDSRKRLPGLVIALSVVLVVALVASTIVFARHEGARHEDIPGDDVVYQESLAELTVKANIVRSSYRAAMRQLDFRNPDRGSTNAFDVAKGVIADARGKMRDLFRGVYQVFPPSADVERRNAQRLYGEIMTEIDMVEENLEFEELKYAAEKK